MSYSDTLEESFNIAWRVLSQTGELCDHDAAARFLLEKIEDMMRSGERRRLALSNLAIDAYRLSYRRPKLVS